MGARCVSLVEDDPDDADIPLGPPPYPGGNDVFPFNNDDDRILEGDTNGWGWQGNEEGHFKELQDGENIMYIFHRQGNESQLVDLYYLHARSHRGLEEELGVRGVAGGDRAFSEMKADGAIIH